MGTGHSYHCHAHQPGGEGQGEVAPYPVVSISLTFPTVLSQIKCHKYWPDELERTKVYDSIHVYFQEALILAESTVRTFGLRMDGSKEERIVRQFHYTVWPDHGVPDYPTPLLQFVRKVASFNPANAGPMVVHCR